MMRDAVHGLILQYLIFTKKNKPPDYEFLLVLLPSVILPGFTALGCKEESGVLSEGEGDNNIFYLTQLTASRA